LNSQPQRLLIIPSHMTTFMLPINLTNYATSVHAHQVHSFVLERIE